MNQAKLCLLFAAIAFLAAAASGQTLTVLSPNGGESWGLGDPATITWTSAGVSGDVRINLYRSSGVVVGTIANSVPVAAGSYSWTAGMLATGSAAPGGDYVVRLRVIGADTMDSSNAAFSLVGPKPNIHIGSMYEIGWDHTFLPRVFVAGDTVTIQYHLLNDSPNNAGPFHVGLRVGGSIIARNAYAELVGGGEGSGQFTWTATCGSPVEVVADCDGEVAESNEGDNVMTDSGLVCSQPDLKFFTALSCSSGTSTPKAGMRYQFRADVDSERVRADNVRVIGGIVGGAQLYDHTFPVMAGDGGIETVEFIWEVPEGAQRVYFEIDPDNRVAESNEGNNRQELAITGVAAAPFGERYDLSVRITKPGRMLSARTSAIEAQQGKPMTISGEVRGATGAIRDFKVTATVQAKPPKTVVVYEQDFIDPGMLVVPFSFSWTPTTLGSHRITVKVALGVHAAGAGVVDANAANNSDSLPVNVVAGKPRLH